MRHQTLCTGLSGMSWLSDWSKLGFNPRSPIATSFEDSSLDPEDSTVTSGLESIFSTDAESPEPLPSDSSPL